MPPLLFDREIRELDTEEGRAGDVSVEVQLPPGLPPVERVGAVDEPVLDQ
jgi:hypothetical protein